MKKKSYLKYLLAFSIPFVLLLILCICFNMYPFGKSSILCVDMDGQYVSFFSYFQKVILGEKSILYSFSKTLGGDMIGLFLYYLASPLNLILLLFDVETLPAGILLLTLIKVGLSGLTMYIYLNKTFKKIPSLLFSTCYALMSYNFVYFQNIMWIDGIILLPLVILGLDELIEGKKVIKYIIFLFLTIFTNYYIGYMVCIFSLLYFIFKLLSKKGSFKDNKIIIGKFIGSSLLAVGISMFALLPNIFSLLGGKGIFNTSDYTLNQNFRFFEFIAKLYNGSFDYFQIGYGEPNVYAGTIINILCIFYFINPKINKKEKIHSLFLTLIIFIGFYIKSFDNIWHLFRPPVWFPYRYSFVFSFFMIIIAIKSFINIKYIKVKPAVITLIIYIIFSIFIFLSNWNYYNFSSPVISAIVNIALIIILSILLLLYKHYIKKKVHKLLLSSIIILTIGDLIFNGIIIMSCLPYKEIEEYQNYLEDFGTVIDNIKYNDNSLYRMDSNFRYSNNDALLFDYISLSHFSSAEKLYVRNFMQKMGFTNNDNYAYYNNGSTTSVDALFGVKYIMSKYPLDNQYNLINEQNGIYTYQNPYALPFAFMSNKQIKNVKTTTSDLFNLQNQIYSGLLDEKTNLFKEIEDIDIEYVNVEKSIKTPANTYYKSNPEKVAYILFEFEATSDGPIYAYFDSHILNEATLFINNDYIGPYFTYYDYNIISLGNYKKGETIELSIGLKEDEVHFNDYFIYSLDLNKLEESTNILNNTEVIKENDYTLRLNVENNNFDFLFTSIPYEKGWSAYIDGKKTETIKVLDTLMGIHLPKGNHEIKFVYCPQGLKEGIIISFLSLCVFVSILYRYKFKKKKRLVQ